EQSTLLRSVRRRAPGRGHRLADPAHSAASRGHHRPRQEAPLCALSSAAHARCVVGLAEELGGQVHAGYRLELLYDHFADPTPLVERLPTATGAAIAHPDLKVHARYGMTIAGDVVAGRLEEVDEDDEFGLLEEGPRVIVDGRSVSW